MPVILAISEHKSFSAHFHVVHCDMHICRLFPCYFTCNYLTKIFNFCNNCLDDIVQTGVQGLYKIIEAAYLLNLSSIAFGILSGDPQLKGGLGSYSIAS